MWHATEGSRLHRGFMSVFSSNSLEQLSTSLHMMTDNPTLSHTETQAQVRRCIHNRLAADSIIDKTVCHGLREPKNWLPWTRPGSRDRHG